MVHIDALPGFTILGSGQHLYLPPLSTDGPGAAFATVSKVQPDLIILCPWLFAAPRHIAKYISQYQTIYPSARMLLLQNDMSNTTWRPDWVQMQRLQPSVEAIRQFLKEVTVTRDGIRAEPTILLHAFSDGGSHSAVQLAQAYRETIAASIPETGPPLPAEIPFSAVVMDSCPGRSDFFNGVQVALSFIPPTQPLKRLMAMPIAYAIVAGIVGMHELGIAEDIASKIWRHMNDPTGPFLMRPGNALRGEDAGAGLDGDKSRRHIVPRTYIYSRTDELVPEDDVVQHAAEARNTCALVSKGPNETRDSEGKVRLEEFVGSMHVNHLSVDRERYWRIVQETFDQGVEMSKPRTRLGAEL